MSRRPGSRPRLPRVALVGRPNVGKSSLFNRLLGSREAIVHDRPGVTRDRIEREGTIEGHRVILEDTGGLVPESGEELQRAVSEQALAALGEADLLVLVVDGRAGVTPLDEEIAALLRRRAEHVIVAVNKIDVPRVRDLAAEAWSLGLGEPVPVSAEHGLGVDRLAREIVSRIAARPAAASGEGEAGDEAGSTGFDPEGELAIAVVGRPNVGKSSLVNRLAGAPRVTVSPVPGTTRDAIDVLLVRDGLRYRLVDTAGLRRRGRVADRDESVGILLARRRIERSDIAVLVLDAVAGVTTGDVSIAGEIEAAGRPLVLAFNKWDLVENPDARARELDDAVRRRLAFLPGPPVVRLSALHGQRAFRVLDRCRDLARRGARRVPTGELNRFVADLAARLRDAGTGAPKIFYVTQVGVFPPRFLAFARRAHRIEPSFRRHLERRLREAFDLGPVPVRLEFREPPRRGGG